MKITRKGVSILIDKRDESFFKENPWSLNYGSNGNPSIKTRGIAVSRLLLNAPKGLVVDHINGNIYDNRRKNLRICTHAENMRNRVVLSKSNTSGFKGVSFARGTRKNPWRACVNLNGKRHRYSFPTKLEAAKKYNELASSLYGEFARLNPL